MVSEAEAATALVRSVDDRAALLLVDDETATLTTVGTDSTTSAVLASVPIGAAGAAAACAAVLAGMQAQPQAPVKVMLVSNREDLESVAAGIREQSSVPVELPTDASFAIARGAAQTVGWALVDPAGPATQLAPAASPATQLAPVSAPVPNQASDAVTGLRAAAEPQLAYSMAEPDPLPMGMGGYDDAPYEMPMDPLSELIPEHDDDATTYTEVVAPVHQRMILMGSAVAFLIVSFATLAVTVAINVRPAASTSDLTSPPVQSDTVPGRYLPPVPHEPDPVAQPVAVLTPPPVAPPAPKPNVSPRTNNGPVNPPAGPPIEQRRRGSTAAARRSASGAGHSAVSAVHPDSDPTGRDLPAVQPPSGRRRRLPLRRHRLHRPHHRRRHHPRHRRRRHPRHRRRRPRLRRRPLRRRRRRLHPRRHVAPPSIEFTARHRRRRNQNPWRPSRNRSTRRRPLRSSRHQRWPPEPAPVQQAPVQQAPVQQAPVEQAPVIQAPVTTVAVLP